MSYDTVVRAACILQESPPDSSSGGGGGGELFGLHRETGDHFNSAPADYSHGAALASGSWPSSAARLRLARTIRQTRAW